MSDEKHIHYITEGNSDLDKHSGYTTPGWYFSDEGEYLHGPFDTQQVAVTALGVYCAENL
ncbi:MAG: hypothetical protein ACXABY_30595 [Candidatus Thorarchaeota archaeon]|jgi:hypothetical protein